MNKECLFCTTKIKNHFYTCKKHVEWLYQYKQTDWFQELIKMESKQKQIDYKESMPYYSNVVQVNKQTTSKKRKLDYSKIISLKRTHTQKQLAVMFNCHERTIQNIIRRYGGHLSRKNKKT